MSRLSLRQLEIFRAIMRTGSLTAASGGLGISQPAASRLLRHAEDQLGVLLFERRNNRLRPTAEAKALYPEVDRLLANLDYVERVADDLHRLKAGRLRIVTITSFALTLVADAIGRFRETYPAVTIQIETALNYEVPNVVLNRSADLGLAFMPLRTDGLRIKEIWRTLIVVVVPRGHCLASCGMLGAAELAGEPLISFSRALPIGAHIADVFENAGVRPSVAVEVGHSFLACTLVRAGAGIALVDGLAEDSAMFPDLCFIPLDPAMPISAVMLTTQDETPSLVADAFARILGDFSYEESSPLLYRPRL